MPHPTILSRKAAAVKKDRDRDGGLSLPSLEALLGLVDDIDAALATHETVVAMAVAQGFQRITDFHDITGGLYPRKKARGRITRRRPYASNQGGDQGRAVIL
jgi:hypothetical protein